MPRIKTTRTVTVALFLLRIYLIVMLVLILVKFVLVSRGSSAHTKQGPSAAIMGRAMVGNVVSTSSAGTAGAHATGSSTSPAATA